jgi:hypothetical protein
LRELRRIPQSVQLFLGYQKSSVDEWFCLTLMQEFPQAHTYTHTHFSTRKIERKSESSFRCYTWSRNGDSRGEPTRSEGSFLWEGTSFLMGIFSIHKFQGFQTWWHVVAQSLTSLIQCAILETNLWKWKNLFSNLVSEKTE